MERSCDSGEQGKDDNGTQTNLKFKLLWVKYGTITFDKLYIVENELVLLVY